MTQTQQVIEAMKELGGFATFGKLNSVIDFSEWKTKTPEASVRRIVQDNAAFFKIKPGLWALEEFKEDIFKKFNLKDSDEHTEMEFSHSYYQGLVVEIGNLRSMNTFVPNQDKNKLFLDMPLKEVTNLSEIYQFTYPEIVRYARTVDVIWFNERHMPHAFFEIEHSTDIQNSLLKFYELQDFNAEFYIVADEYRYNKFNDLINRSIFKSIRERIKFRSYDSLSDIHSQAYRQARAEAL
ncbi:MAG: hypothetical protein FWE78_05555 [Methanimicrococcus sp.]|nr:hypothetical protein [Methanimicrococcus sp.]